MTARGVTPSTRLEIEHASRQPLDTGADPAELTEQGWLTLAEIRRREIASAYSRGACDGAVAVVCGLVILSLVFVAFRLGGL